MSQPNPTDQTMDILNDDVLQLVLERLPVDDRIQNQLVSRQWRDRIQWINQRKPIVFCGLQSLIPAGLHSFHDGDDYHIDGDLKIANMDNDELVEALSQFPNTRSLCLQLTTKNRMKESFFQMINDLCPELESLYLDLRHPQIPWLDRHHHLQHHPNLLDDRVRKVSKQIVDGLKVLPKLKKFGFNGFLVFNSDASPAELAIEMLHVGCTYERLFDFNQLTLMTRLRTIEFDHVDIGKFNEFLDSMITTGACQRIQEMTYRHTSIEDTARYEAICQKVNQSFGNLTRLRMNWLRYRDLVDDDKIAIPSAFNRLKKLEVLHVSRIFDLIPVRCHPMPALKKLYFRGLKLTRSSFDGLDRAAPNLVIMNVDMPIFECRLDRMHPPPFGGCCRDVGPILWAKLGVFNRLKKLRWIDTVENPTTLAEAFCRSFACPKNMKRCHLAFGRMFRNRPLVVNLMTALAKLHPKVAFELDEVGTFLEKESILQQANDNNNWQQFGMGQKEPVNLQDFQMINPLFDDEAQPAKFQLVPLNDDLD